MRDLMSIKKKRGMTSCNRAVVKRLAKMLLYLDRKGLPPVDLLRQSLECEENAEDVADLGRAFLELCRLREYAEGLAPKSKEGPERMQTVVVLYLLTGHLRPENERLLHKFVVSTEFELLASAIYVLERLGPVDRYFYQYLFKRNIYSKEFADYWSSNAKMYSIYAQKFISGMKRANEKLSLSSVLLPNERSKLKFNITEGSSKSCSRIVRGFLSHSDVLSANANDSRVQNDLPATIDPRRTLTVQRRGVPNKSITFFNKASAVKLTKKEKLPQHNSENVFQSDSEINLTTKSDTTDVLNIDIEEIEAQEELDKTNVKQKSISRVYKEKSRLIKERTDFKNTEGLSFYSKKNAFPSFRTNAATLLKEAAIILKEEEEENRKILKLIDGSSNYLEYERMIKERMEEEKELFKLKIQKLHLEGKLTEQAAILAKLRLEKESKARRKEFEEERNKLLEDMFRLRENEVQKINELVEKVREIRERISIKKKSLENEKRQAVEKLSREIRRSLTETMDKQKKELENKVLMIKEVRAFEAFKKSLKGKHSFFKSTKDQENLGFLSEMSLEELAEKKKYMQQAIKEEIRQRQQHILDQMESREMLLDAAEDFIWNSRHQRQRKRNEKNDSIMTKRIRDTIDSIPDTFRRPVPIFYQKELAYKIQAIEIKDCRNMMKNKVLKEKRKCQNRSKSDANRFDNYLNSYLKRLNNRQNYSDQMHNDFDNQKKLGTHSHTKITGKTSAIKSERTLNKDTEENIVQQSVLYTSFWVHDETKKFLWEKFKHYINNFTKLHLPAKFQALIMPPVKWMKKIEKSRTTKNIQSKKISKLQTKNSRKKKGKRKSNLSLIKKSNKISERKWIRKWKQFYKNLTNTEYKLAPRQCLENLDNSYTKKIINHVKYYNSTSFDRALKDEDKLKNVFIKNAIDYLRKLKAQYESTVEEVREARKCKTIQLQEPGLLIQDTRRNKPGTPLRNRLILPHSCRPRFVTDYQERVIQNPLFEEEDREIRETVLYPPHKDKTQTKPWITDGQDERPVRMKLPKPVIHDAPIPLVKMRQRPAKSLNRVNALQKEVKLKFGSKYHHMKNTHGNSLYILKPSAKNILKWEWHGIEVKKLRHLNVSYETSIPSNIRRQVPLDKISPEVLKKSTQNRIGLLGKLQSLRFRDGDMYLRSLKGQERIGYFNKVPIKMILDYFKEHPFGGDPNKKPLTDLSQ